MQELIQRAARDLTESKMATALTGAGISVESGIPPFRGKGGIWEKIDPMEFAHIDALHRDPAKVWKVLIKEMKEILDTAQPNEAHKGLARMEKLGVLKTIITQNVDGLHQMAGNTDVIEFHGNFAWLRCMDCGFRIPTADVNLEKIPPRCSCRGIYRPECVFFGEMIPSQHMGRSQMLAAQSDVMLVVGTSASVQPAAHIPVLSKQSGATVIEVNPERTPLTGAVSDYLIMGPAGEMIRRIVAALEQNLHKSRS